MILPMYIFGQPVLRKQAEEISADYPDLQKLISDMIETMKNAEGVGLAAPQIGLPIRLVVVDLDALKDEYPEYEGFLKAYINPQIVEYSEETCSIEEGCLSVPGIHESVRRPEKVHITYLDQDLQSHDEWVEGFLARVLQHEFDHLEGKMFVDRLTPLRKQMVKKKLMAMAKGKFQCNYKHKPNH